FFCLFFFQAEDGIRDFHVTGVQTCALPIYCYWAWSCAGFCCRAIGCSNATCCRPDTSLTGASARAPQASAPPTASLKAETPCQKIGRASCRERVEITVVDVA